MNKEGTEDAGWCFKHESGRNWRYRVMLWTGIRREVRNPVSHYCCYVAVLPSLYKIKELLISEMHSSAWSPFVSFGDVCHVCEWALPYPLPAEVFFCVSFVFSSCVGTLTCRLILFNAKRGSALLRLSHQSCLWHVPSIPFLESYESETKGLSFLCVRVYF